MREHRLYQADWLYRYYGFAMDEVLDATDDGMLALDLDPKLAWALRNRGLFPIDVNAASREELLRVPGLGVRSVDRIIDIRRLTAMRLDDVAKADALGQDRALLRDRARLDAGREPRPLQPRRRGEAPG